MKTLVAATAAFALAGIAAPVLARGRGDALGTLTFYEADGTTGHDVALTSMFVPVPTPPGAPSPHPQDSEDQRSITVTAEVAVPDPALIAWLRDEAHAKRRVVLKINDGTDTAAHVSTFETAAGQLTGWTAGYSGGGGGTQTLVVTMEHMSINGTPVY